MTLHKRTLRHLALGILLAAAYLPIARTQITSEPARAPRETVLFPLENVHAGLKGVAYTVFEGVTPEAMEVDILGRLSNALGPGRDLILARLRGTKPEYTGVVAGMSGSPVYVDGRLLGALSYRIGQFSKEPIAGITPIEQMLEAPPRSIEAAPAAGAAPHNPDLRPIESPLVFSGFSEEAVARFGEPFRAMGLLPVSGLGGRDETRRQTAPLEPGSAVSAVLVDGDLSVTGTCTVSYVVGSRLLACGHPITQAGHIDLPMAKAEVLATLASPLNSFKIVNATEIAGAFTEDRASALAGQIGASARTIPVTIDLTPDGQASPAKTIRFNVANHREMTPQLMMVSLYQSLQQVVSGSAEASYKISGEIQVAGNAGSSPLPPVAITGWQVQTSFNPGAVNAALALGERISPLFAVADQQVLLTGVQLHILSSASRRSATLESARLDTTEARPGQLLQMDTVLRPYQRPQRVLHMQVRLPGSLEPGTFRLLVSDGATLDRLQEPAAPHPLTLIETVARLNHVHANDRVYVTLLSRDAQAVLDGGTLSEVPLSLANVLEPLKNNQRLRLTGESVVELGSTEMEDAVTGYQVISLTVKP